MVNIFRTKCLVIGDSAVGKTAIVKALASTSNQFPIKYTMTTDIDVSVKKFNQSSDQIVELYLYDCSGKAFYQPILHTICSNNSPLIVAVFDVTNEETLNSLHNWLSEVAKDITKEKVTGIILGNKVDLDERVVVRGDEAHQLAKKYKMRYFETTAKDSATIEEAFNHLVSVCVESRNKSTNN